MTNLNAEAIRILQKFISDAEAQEKSEIAFFDDYESLATDANDLEERRQLSQACTVARKGLIEECERALRDS